MNKKRLDTAQLVNKVAGSIAIPTKLKGKRINTLIKEAELQYKKQMIIEQKLQQGRMRLIPEVTKQKTQ